MQNGTSHSPWKEVAIVSRLPKEVGLGLSIQNDYEKQCHGNPILTDKKQSPRGVL